MSPVRWASGPRSAMARRKFQSLGVRLRLPGEPWKNRQARAQEHQGKPALLNPVHRHDERAQLLLVEVLELVDEESHRALPVLGCLRDSDKEIGQIDFQVTAV